MPTRSNNRKSGNDRGLLAAIDIGTSSRPSGGAPGLKTGGSAKVRLVDVASGQTVYHFPGTEAFGSPEHGRFLDELAGQPPRRFVRVIADKLLHAIQTCLSGNGKIKRVTCGFPAVIVNGVADHVANLRYVENGRETPWSNVDLIHLMSKAFQIPRGAVTVVNDVIPGLLSWTMDNHVDLRPGHHVMYVAPGGGLGVAEAMCIGNARRGQILVTASEQGHTLAVPRTTYREGCLCAAPAVPLRLESAFCSTRAIEANYRELSGTDLGCASIIEQFSQSRAAKVSVGRCVEGLALLIANAATRGVNRVVIAGPLAGSISRKLQVCTGKNLVMHVISQFPQAARKDLIDNVVISEYSAPDNTQGGILLAEAAETVPGKASWLVINRRSLSPGNSRQSILPMSSIGS